MLGLYVASASFALLAVSLIPTVEAAPGVCYRTRASVGYYSSYSTRLYYYSESYSTCCSQFLWCWNSCSKSRTRSAYEGYYSQKSRTVYSKQSLCCSGYSGSPSSGCNPVCSGGCGHGSCTNPGVCSCHSGWTGQKCNNDINECSSSNGNCAQNCHNKPGSYSCSCNSGYQLSSNGRSCSDINECSSNKGGCAHSCSNSVGSYKCSCNNGYQLTSNKHSCTDVNECSDENGGCDHNCHNTVGSYYCTCNTGYVLLDDERDCTDHDECASNNHGCDHQCHNTHGGYHCSCNTGYTLQGTKTCVDTNECDSNNGGCSQSCTNSVGSYHCSCTTGYTLAIDGHGCNDINECSTNNGGCQHHCTNTDGSYVCSCNEGYKLSNDGYTCEDINECSSGNGGCGQSCVNQLGSYKCGCGSGYLLSSDAHICNDIDECSTSNGGCQDICHNLLGSYQCSCDSGFLLLSDGHSCKDVNECSVSNGQCNHTCHNTNGSYHCTCNDGYLLLEDMRGCTDHDECASNNHGCDHQCHNTHGGYNCSCNTGYTLQGIETCVDINECNSSITVCDHVCVNTNGSFTCSCHNGYQLDTTDNSTCLDVDECESDNGGCGQMCVNSQGSYQCSCEDGYHLANNNHFCLDTDECFINNGGCQHGCSNYPGGYSCVCHEGYRLDYTNNHTCNDIDECGEGVVDIGGTPSLFWCDQQCVNTAGWYECTCDMGYHLDTDNKTCLDVNECSVSNGQCNHTCHNTNGSYHCTCNDGYLLLEDMRGCTDHDECINNIHECDHMCHNTAGGYYCTCHTGYTLVGPTSCVDVDECAESVSGCNQICTNAIGSFSCSCYSGYQLSVNNNATCFDINECGVDNGGCNQSCVNTPGSYYCLCSEGYALENDNHSCTDINECLNDNGGCSHKCGNSLGSYSCSCPHGFRLKNDSHTCEDINECLEDIVKVGGVSPDDSLWCEQDCVNTDGGFTCACIRGYLLNEDNVTCSDVNECSVFNGQCDHTCHNTNGSYHCTCNDGFILLDDHLGCEDHDECLNHIDDCDHKCHNIRGGYSCSCYEGFRLRGDSGTCDDIDECVEDVSGCSDICHNTNGSFECSCHNGYYLSHDDNRTCIDINECVTEHNNCSQVCINNPGSYHCDCDTGYMLYSDLTTCSGEPCFNLTTPLNSDVWCSGSRVTDQYCTFTCHPGYILSGSPNRTCLSNHTWDSQDALCSPMDCPHLIAPVNAFVVLPCIEQFTSSCSVVCDNGFHVSNTSSNMWTQQCVLDDSVNGSSVQWTEAKSCVVTDPCQGSPCGSGVCSVLLDDSIQCDCQGTLRIGERCQLSVLDIYPLEPVDTSVTREVTVTSALTVDVSMTITSSDPSQLLINGQSDPFVLHIPKSTEPVTTQYTIIANSPGIYGIKYEPSPVHDIVTPEDSVVLVVSPDSENRDTYFDVLNLTDGNIVPGCCKHKVADSMMCGSSDITFHSSCSWSGIDDNTWSTNGVVFADSEFIQLPVSISGLSIQNQPLEYSMPLNSLGQCTSCNKSLNDDCQSTGSLISYDLHDVNLFLESQSLLKTAIRQLNPVLPEWLDVTVLMPEQSHSAIRQSSYSAYDYSASFLKGQEINNIPECQSTVPVNDNLYYLLRTRAILNVEVYSFSASLYDGPYCIAVDMCRRLLYVAVPTELQPSQLIGFDFVKNLLSGNGQLYVGTIVFGKRHFVKEFDQNLQYWNGNRLVTPSLPNFDYELQSIEFSKTFVGGNLRVHYDFTGSVLHRVSNTDSKVSGLLVGTLIMELCTLAHGSTTCLSLTSTDNPSLFVTPGMDLDRATPFPLGISSKLLYNANASSSISNSFTVLPNTQTCTIDGFMHLDSLLNINGISFTSGGCLGLKLGSVQLPENFKHDVYFVGQGLNDDTSIVYRSKIDTDRVNVGPFYEVFVNDPKDVAMQVTLASNDFLTTGFIRNVNVSVFDSQIYTKELSITNGYFSFQGDAVIFEHFHAHFVGRSSLDHSIESLPLEIEAKILNSDYEFLRNLSYRLNSHMKSELGLLVERQTNAHVSYETANDLYKNVSNQYDRALMEYNQIMIELQSVNETYQQMIVQVAETQNTYLSSLEEFNANNNNPVDVDSTCSANYCDRNCEDSNICSICHSTDTLEETGICQVQVSVDTLVTREKKEMKKVWRYDTKCHKCWKLVWYLLPYYTPGECCSIVSVPVIEYHYEPDRVSMTLQQTQYEACSVGTLSANTSFHCCEKYQCAFRFHNLTCLALTATCLQEQQQILQDNGSYELQVKHKEYIIASENFTETEIELTKLETKLFVIKQELQLLEDARRNAFDMREIREKARNSVQNLTQIYNELTVDPMAQFKILNVSFQLTLTNTTPVAFPIDVLVEFNGQIRGISVVVNFQNSLESIYRQVSVKIIKTILESGSRRKREVGNSVAYNNHALTCIEINNIQSYTEQVVNSSTISLYGQHDTNEKINDMLLDFGNENVESRYNSIELETNSLIGNVRQVVDDYAFLYWQMSQQLFYTNVSGINGYNCVDQIDCLLIMIYDLNYVLEDTSLIDVEFLKHELSSAKSDIVDTSVDSEGMNSALERLLKVILRIKELNYWCSKPPVMIKQLPVQVTLMAGDTLELTCTVQSDLNTNYYWLRDSVLLNFKSSKLVITDIRLSEAGKYQCIATNDAGSVSSLISLVNIYSIPVLNQTLASRYKTYAGNDNGFTLACDAYALPSPGWKWLYKSNLVDDWKEIDNSHSNILTFSKVVADDEGYYACSAYNLVGSVTSTLAFLHVLPTEIVKIQYPIAFTLFSNNTDTIHTDSLQEIITAKIHSHLHLVSTQIDNFAISNHHLLHTRQVSFSLTTPIQEYTSKLSMEEIVNVLLPMISQLEVDKKLIATEISEIVSNTGMDLTPSSFHIGSRHFVCPNGYEIHESQLLCVGCSPGEHRDSLRTIFTDVGNGTIIEQVVPKCVECSIGQYQDNVAQTNCHTCPDYYSTSTTGSSTSAQCTMVCGPHTMSQTGLQPCVECPEHYFQPNHGATECIHCGLANMYIEQCMNFFNVPTSFSTVISSLQPNSTFTPIISPAQSAFNNEVVLTVMTFMGIFGALFVLISIVVVLIIFLKKRQKRSPLSIVSNDIQLDPVFTDGKCEEKDIEFKEVSKQVWFTEKDEDELSAITDY